MANAQPKRCTWVNVDQVLMREYHDREWGVPTHDDRTHFEFLILEAAQAGLSWSIVLNKRDGYRRAFSDFNPEKVARYSAARIDRLTADPGIIRNRAKIAAAVKNARAFLAVREEHGSFDAYCWQFVDGRPRDLRPHAGSRNGERSLNRLFPISRRSAARHPGRMNPTWRRQSEAQMTNLTRLFKNECGSRS